MRIHLARRCVAACLPALLHRQSPLTWLGVVVLCGAGDGAWRAGRRFKRRIFGRVQEHQRRIRTSGNEHVEWNGAKRPRWSRGISCTNPHEETARRSASCGSGGSADGGKPGGWSTTNWRRGDGTQGWPRACRTRGSCGRRILHRVRHTTRPGSEVLRVLRHTLRQWGRHGITPLPHSAVRAFKSIPDARS
jgi:hypothetical protein